MEEKPDREHLPTHFPKKTVRRAKSKLSSVSVLTPKPHWTCHHALAISSFYIPKLYFLFLLSHDLLPRPFNCFPKSPSPFPAPQDVTLAESIYCHLFTSDLGRKGISILTAYRRRLWLKSVGCSLTVSLWRLNLILPFSYHHRVRTTRNSSFLTSLLPRSLARSPCVPTAQGALCSWLASPCSPRPRLVSCILSTPVTWAKCSLGPQPPAEHSLNFLD